MRRALVLASLLALGCVGVPALYAVSEPIFVHGAPFRAGALPGLPPLAEGETPPTGVPLVTAIDSASAILIEGQLDRHLAGRTSEDAYAVALRLESAGTGYYTVPVGALDPAFPGERDFDLDFDVGSRVPSGLTHLSVVAIDGAGHAGPRRDLDVCLVDGAIPSELSVCDPSITPPAAAIVLRWDSEADLDLVITTPDGKRVDARHPTTYDAGTGSVPASALSDPTIGRLVRDSNAGCDTDGRNEEVLVWNEAPEGAGAFFVGVDLFAACSTWGAHFTVTVLRRQTAADGTHALVVAEERSGELLAVQADEGRTAPLYVTFVSF
jgi:hypothetical protein